MQDVMLYNKIPVILQLLLRWSYNYIGQLEIINYCKVITFVETDLQSSALTVAILDGQVVNHMRHLVHVLLGIALVFVPAFVPASAQTSAVTFHPHQCHLLFRKS